MAVPDGRRRCPGCGAPLDLGARFCGGCGTPIDATTSGPPQTAERNAVSRPGRWSRARLVSLAGLATVLLVVGVVLVASPRAGGDLPSEASAQFAFSDDSYAASGRAGSAIPVAVIVHASPELFHLTFTASLEGDPFPLVVLNEPAGAVSELEEPVQFGVPVEARPGLGDAGTQNGEVVAVGCTVPLEDGECPSEAVLTVTAEVAVHVDALDPDVVPHDYHVPHADRFGMTRHNEVVADELLLLTDRSLDAAGASHTVLEASRRVGALLVGADAEAGIFQLAFEDPSQVERAHRELSDLPDVEVVLRHSLVRPADTHLPDDYGDEPWTVDAPAGRNWHLEVIDAPSAWEQHTGSDDVKVGIIDAGFRVTHEDLRDNIRSHRSYGLGDGTARGHGTMVAGIACARGNNAQGISGVAQRCALHLYDLPVERRGIPDVVIFQAMRAAIADEVEVANLSLGSSPGCDGELLETADASGYRRYVENSPDTLWIIGAGNDCMDAASTVPAVLGADQALENVLVVASVNSDGSLEPMSNFGSAVAVAAPGGWDIASMRDDPQRARAADRELRHRYGVWTTWDCSSWQLEERLGWCRGSDSGYTGSEGTSMAAPVVAGVAALARAAEPDATAAEIRTCIVSAAQASGRRAQHPPDWLRPDIPRRFTDEDLAALPIVTAGATLVCLASPPGVDLETLVWSRVVSDDVLETFTDARAVTAGGPGFVAVGQAGDDAAVWTSPDGRSWTRVPHQAALADGDMHGIVAGGPGLVAVGQDWSGPTHVAAVWTSSDGATWFRVSHDDALFGSSGDEQSTMRAVTAGGPGLVAVGSLVPTGRSDARAAVVWTSVDGLNWTRVPHDESVLGDLSGMNGVGVGGPGLVAVGGSTVWTSPDGLAWSRTYEIDSGYMSAITPGGPGLVAVGTDGDAAAVWTSRGGTSWTRVPHDDAVFSGPQSQSMNSVIAGPGGLVAVGSDYTILLDPEHRPGLAAPVAAVWTSPDGMSWSRVPQNELLFGGADNKDSNLVRAVTAGDRQFVAVGLESVRSRAAIWIAEPAP